MYQLQASWIMYLSSLLLNSRAFIFKLNELFTPHLVCLFALWLNTRSATDLSHPSVCGGFWILGSNRSPVHCFECCSYSCTLCTFFCHTFSILLNFQLLQLDMTVYRTILQPAIQLPHNSVVHKVINLYNVWNSLTDFNYWNKIFKIY